MSPGITAAYSGPLRIVRRDLPAEAGALSPSRSRLLFVPRRLDVRRTRTSLRGASVLRRLERRSAPPDRGPRQPRRWRFSWSMSRLHVLQLFGHAHRPAVQLGLDRAQSSPSVRWLLRSKSTFWSPRACVSSAVSAVTRSRGLPPDLPTRRAATLPLRSDARRVSSAESTSCSFQEIGDQAHRLSCQHGRSPMRIAGGSRLATAPADVDVRSATGRRGHELRMSSRL